jgi:imidazolonepropionase-like amidohydrolase
MRASLAAAMIAWFIAPAAFCAQIAITHVTVIHPERVDPRARFSEPVIAPDQTILIDGAKIKAVGPADRIAVPRKAQVIDAKGKWAIPGLIDAHMHFWQNGGLYTRPDLIDFTRIKPYKEDIEWTRSHLSDTFKRWLASGVTGVVDAGGPFWNFEVREAARKTAAAPRVVVAGPLVSTLERPQLEVAKAALRSGADYLVHSVEDKPIDDEFLALMRERNALYCPTLGVKLNLEHVFRNKWRETPEDLRLVDPQILRSLHDLDHIAKDQWPPLIVRRMASSSMPEPPVVAMENLRKVWEAGLPVVMGTDAGAPGLPHGSTVFRELQLMQQAGLGPLDVLRAATTNGARALHMPDELGSISPGKLADIVLLDADPAVDVANLSKAHRVIKNGVVFDPAKLVKSFAQ